MRMWKMIVKQERRTTEVVTIAATRSEAEVKMLATITGSIVSMKITAYDIEDVIHIAEYPTIK